MKTISKIEILFFILMLSACGSDSKPNNSPVQLGPNLNPAANGHYLVEAFALEGTCPDPDPVELIIYNGDLYENREDTSIEVTGTIRGKELTGIATLSNDQQIVFDAVILEGDYIQGDWYYTDDSCFGYLTGGRLIDL